MKFLKFFYQVLILFALLCAIFIPFTFQYLPFQSEITHFLFKDLCVFLASFFNITQVINPEISSDSATMYLLFLVLFLLAVLLSSTLSFFNFWKTHRSKINTAIRLVLVYYLALIMLKYGFDKIFKAQFYLPEPNTLYTPLGMLDKDILYWSTMGASRSYTIFMGMMEVIPALMLFYYRTRVLGLLILCGVLLNVVSVNFGFDISVKLFSSFLLLLTLLLLAPWCGNIVRFLLHRAASPLPPLTGKNLIAHNFVRVSFKAALVLIFLTESLLPYIATGNYNDDTAPRNYLHGAYAVTEITANESLPVKRIFIHRRNYLIFQFTDDSMQDFHLQINKANETFVLTDYNDETILLRYLYDDGNQSLTLWSDEIGWKIQSAAIDWRGLPLLKPLFHWTVDGIGTP
jgi:hypothetical protein